MQVPNELRQLKNTKAGLGTPKAVGLQSRFGAQALETNSPEGEL